MRYCVTCCFSMLSCDWVAFSLALSWAPMKLVSTNPPSTTRMASTNNSSSRVNPRRRAGRRTHRFRFTVDLSKRFEQKGGRLVVEEAGSTGGLGRRRARETLPSLHPGNPRPAATRVPTPRNNGARNRVGRFPRKGGAVVIASALPPVDQVGSTLLQVV